MRGSAMPRASQAKTIAQHIMLRTVFLGVLGVVSLGCHRQQPEKKSAALPEEQPAGLKNLPEELDTLNVASRKMYAVARTQELSTIPVVIVVTGDDLVLRRNGKRTVATVIPAEYHALKSISHTTLALFAHLSFEPGKP